MVKPLVTKIWLTLSINSSLNEVGPNLDKLIPNSNLLPPRIPHSLLLYPSTNEISDIISSLDDSKSSGPSTISIKILKIANNHISCTFSDICNISFNEGIFPDK